MFQAFYNGLAGMNASSKALDIVSDNVSNMQTPGFKAKDVFMQNVDTPTKGLGSQVSDVQQRYTQGEVSQTANPTDLFIDGRGLFALQDDDSRYYTRAGMVRMNEDNILVDKLSGFEIIAFDENDQLGKIDISDKLSVPAVPTTEISLRGEMSVDDGQAKIEQIGYVASDGSYRYLSAIVKRIDDSEKWTVSVLDDRENEVGTGEISFESNGTLKTGANKVMVALSEQQNISVSFGEAGSLSGVILGQPGQVSSLKVDSTDGSTESPYNDIRIDDKGKITLTYGNGDEKALGKLALAKVENYQKFTTHSGHLLVNSEETPELVKIGEGIDAKLISGAIELSNVDLAKEFGDMMVIQRSYQASSRVMTVANQLAEQLYGGSGS
ncbi:flagellar hook-basal body complex protein [Vibrio coralliilyticus]|uniref:Flagellar hook protein FlgE n=1 Tax=Vibrio coralliilyticus TaxID=190893 RepID=A0AAP7DE35_9VIBR|nr:flagellar hook-basal body complex protein [Vibrio coralliilyticus]NOJ23557.1 flagellar hook protein FlgE [Vibrio coralliilyticus]